MQAGAGAIEQRHSSLEEPFLVRERAAEFVNGLGIPTTGKTLEQLAARDRGPKYAIVNGRAVYRRSDLLAWVEARMSQPSATATELPGAA